MLDYAKYVVTEGPAERLVFFPPTVPHAAIARMLGGAKVIAAGFLSLVTNAQGKISVSCYGGSEALQVVARPQDCRLAARTLHLEP